MRTAGLFITGTDTGVGKTHLTCLIAREMLARGVVVGAYKPVCTGCEIAPDGTAHWPDVEALADGLGDRFPIDRICPQRFRAPLAPPVAAQEEGRTVDAALLRAGAAWWDGRVELLLVEGVGGLYCPLTETRTVVELAKELAFPILIVARLGLGTINHTLLTVEAAERRGLRIAGIILNETDRAATDLSATTNPREIAARCRSPVLGVLRHNDARGLLREGFRIRMDWLSLAQRG
jgi:dethiobiotin synthetase